MSNVTFETFRRKLADVVTVAINSDRKRVSKHAGTGTVCPLGCLPGASNRPFADWAGHRLGVGTDEAFAFIRGFEGSVGTTDDRGPYYELGKLYRARFP